MIYNREKTLEAWKAFVSSGILLEENVRPEVARSWLRCKQAGVNPWSTDFPERNDIMLKEKRERFERSLKATEPVMKFLVALLEANVSLMDGENFVFELLSPLGSYPLTYGTFMREEEVGTGNATIVAYEKKPIRVDSFEQYRAISQRYSGVSAPFLNKEGKYYGALNINSPLAALPASALDLCTKATDLSSELHWAGSRAHTILATTEFFRPLLLLFEDPVVVLDMKGNILTANGPMRAYCPSWEDFPYGSQSLDAYLSKKNSAEEIVALSEKPGEAVPIHFTKENIKGSFDLNLARCSRVELEDVDPFVVCVFHEGNLSKPSQGRVADKVSSGNLSTLGMADYIGESEEWRQVDSVVQKVASVNTNVLLLGETGTGKEVVARALHRRSGRKGEFVAINCGAVPRDLLATELFGYEGGAFTGARETGSIGKFEYADKGTLFLDEIGEMPVDMQVSMLRVLQDQSITRLGSNNPKPLDVRVIAATNQNIQQLIEEKKFRSDLYFRLSLVEITLPQLRRRTSDIALLVDFFNKELSTALNLPLSPFPETTLKAMTLYSWPGNVRELRNMVERSLIMQGEGANIGINSLPPYIGNSIHVVMPDFESVKGSRDIGSTSQESQLNELETAESLIKDAASLTELIGKHKGSILGAAQEAGVSCEDLCKLLDIFHLEIYVTPTRKKVKQ